MADHPVPPQQAHHPSAHTALHHVPSHVQQNRHVAGGDQQDTHREGPQPVVVQSQLQHPLHIDAPNYNAAHYHLPPPHYPEVPYVHMHQDIGVAEPVPAQAHHFFVPGFQDNRRDDGLYGHRAQFPGADPPENVHGIWLHPPPPADPDMPANDLRIVAGRLINNPDTRVNILRIEPGAGGRFEAWIAIDFANLF